MAVVLVQPAGLRFEAGPGERLMAAAIRAGVRWPTICGGKAECGVCHVEVIAHAGELPAPSAAETAALRRIFTRPRQGGAMRLACQLPVGGDITVLRLGIRP